MQWIQSAVADFEGPLTSYAAKIVGGDRAKDVVQDTFVKLCAQPRESVEDRLAAWLFAVCRNRALDILRKESRVTPLDERMGERQKSPGPVPCEAVQLAQETRLALELLSDLPPKQQEVIRLKFKHGLSYREISEVTKLSVSNVGYLIHVGLTSIRKRMRSQELRRPISAQRGGSR